MIPKGGWVRRFGFLFLACLAAFPHPAPAAAPPALTRNVLLVVADDVGTDSLSVFNQDPGATFPPTPNVDRLAGSGIRFRNAYGYPTCSPTRSAMFTGRYGFRTGIGAAIANPGDPQLSPRDFTLAKALRANPQLGIRSAHIGKWHLSPEPSDPNVIGGWQHFAGALEADLDDYSRWTKVVDGVVAPGTTHYATTDNADDAIRWIGEQGTNRWFLWLAFNASHTPHHKPPNELHSYDNLPATPPQNGSQRRYYEAMTEALDTEMGRVLERVSLDETTVVFLGDNGTPGQVIQPPYTAATAKGTLSEGGIRIPLIVAGAAVTAPGRDSDAVVHVVDLFSTLLELVGVDVGATIPAGMDFDSRSFVPVIRNQAWSPAETMVLSENFGSTVPPGVQGVATRGARYKLIRFDSGREQFYDLSNDPLEGTNLLGTPASTGNLTAAQRAAYNGLSDRLARWHHPAPAAPAVSVAGGAGGALAVALDEQVGVLFTLERSATVDAAAWAPVTNTVTSVGTNAPRVTLFDLSPPAGSAVYRVRATAR